MEKRSCQSSNRGHRGSDKKQSATNGTNPPSSVFPRVGWGKEVGKGELSMKKAFSHSGDVRVLNGVNLRLEPSTSKHNA